MKILVVIPAKVESKRLSQKNMQRVGGKTLIEIAVEYARASSLVTDIVVSTDSEDIKQFIESINLCKCYLQDKHLSEEDVSVVYSHVCEEMGQYGLVVGIQPDNPDHSLPLDVAIAYVISNGLDEFFTVSKDGRKNGAVRIIRMPRTVTHMGSLLDDCVNIHTKEDLSKASSRMLINSDPLQLGDDATFVIAEAACNHMCSVVLAKAMIDCAASAGADAIKFQTYKGDRTVTKQAPAFWGTETMKQVDYYKRLDRFNEDDYKVLFDYSESKSIIPFSTPFSIEDASLLNKLGMKIFKIPSFEIVNLCLIRYIASLGKPIILSTGAATYAEIDAAIDVVISEKNYNLALMACTLSYPTADENANLSRIQTLKNRYPNIMIGMSDHTEPDENMIIPSVAVSLGARIIEKHYTMSRKMTGSGHFFSVEPNDLKRMVANIRLCERVIGNGEMGTAECEIRAKEGGRKSVVAACDIGCGEIITNEMITLKRPGTGICPSRINDVVGKKATVDIREDSLIQMSDLTMGDLV